MTGVLLCYLPFFFFFFTFQERHNVALELALLHRDQHSVIGLSQQLDAVDGAV